MANNAFEGGYRELAFATNIEVSNLRNCLIYLDALGIVKIVRCKEDNDAKHTLRKDGKVATFNRMIACYLVDNWMEALIKQYEQGNITLKPTKKRELAK